jgi:hypothetical protein
MINTNINSLLERIAEFYDLRIDDDYASTLAEFFTVREIAEFNKIRSI